MTRERALVIGAGIAGLLVARALAADYRAVTLIERDALAGSTDARRGVPQGLQAHVLIQSGDEAIAEIFADEPFDLAAAGALQIDPTLDLRWFQDGVWKARFKSGLRMHWCDRPRFEEALRRRVTALPNVEILTERRAKSLIHDGPTVRGVQVVDPEERSEDLIAGLVVDASGAGSRAPQWLRELGFPRVPEDVVTVDVGYSSRVFRDVQLDQEPGRVLVIYPKPPQSRRGGVLYPVDNERWLAGLVGWVGDHPPVDKAGYLSFAQSLPRPDLYEAIRVAQALTPVRKHVFPANRWRRFERVAGWPDRFLVVGDAVCRFNPVYGQGMSVSALDAVTIARALRSERDPGAAGEAQRLQRALARHRAAAWLLAIVADLRFPEARGRRPAWLWPLDFYTRGVLSISGDDPSTHLRFVRVAGLLDSPALMIHPATVAKVFQRALLSL